MKRKRSGSYGGIQKRQRYSAPPPRLITSGTPYRTVPRTRGVYASGETKYAEAAIDLTNITAAANWGGLTLPISPLLAAAPIFSPVGCMFAPIGGSAINQRIGNRVAVHKVTYRIFIHADHHQALALGQDGAMIRIISAIDKQPNGATASGTLLMETTPGVSNAICAFQSTANFGRFKVLKDMTTSLQNPNLGTTGGGTSSQGLDKYFKITHKFKKPVQVRFNGTGTGPTGSIADVVDNAFQVYANTTTTALTPQIALWARFYYKDF